MWISFLIFEIPNHYSQHPLLSLAELTFMMRVSVIWGSYLFFLGLSLVYCTHCETFVWCSPVNQPNPIFIGRTDAEAPILWPPDANSRLNGKDPNAGKRLKAGGEGNDRGWNGWMASPTQWTWVWANFRSWWGTGKPGILQSMGLAVLGLLQSKSQTWLSNWITTPVNLSHVNLIFRQARKTSKGREEFLPPRHSQDVSQGCSHLKVWLGLNEPLPE